VLPPELKEFMDLCKQRDRNYQLVNILLLGKKIDQDTLLWAVKQANARFKERGQRCRLKTV